MYSSLLFPRSSFVIRRGTPSGWQWRKWRKNEAFIAISTRLHFQQGILTFRLWYIPIEILGRNRVCHSSYGIIPAILGIATFRRSRASLVAPGGYREPACGWRVAQVAPPAASSPDGSESGMSASVSGGSEVSSPLSVGLTRHGVVRRKGSSIP